MSHRRRTRPCLWQRLLAAILDAHPSCRGILFDLPEVVAQAVPLGVLHDWAEAPARLVLVESVITDS
jgi:hypothetical protein